MEPSHHSLSDLFDQLGLPSADQDIQAFIELHRPLPAETRIESAEIFSESQRAFLRQAYDEDSDWVVAVEHLDAMLR